MWGAWEYFQASSNYFISWGKYPLDIGRTYMIVAEWMATCFTCRDGVGFKMSCFWLTLYQPRPSVWITDWTGKTSRPRALRFSLARERYTISLLHERAAINIVWQPNPTFSWLVCSINSTVACFLLANKSEDFLQLGVLHNGMSKNR